MQYKSSFACSTAVAALLLLAPPLLPIDSAVPVAQAAVSVSLNVFFDELAPHGDWVSYDGNYVFVPARVERGWRPYTRGHWVYADQYGWTWSSTEKFGWATYHYGRWGHGDDIGWYWVPGTRWAPAWVSWRRSNDHVVWAPLPPDRNDDVSVNISIGSIPEFYWVAVPTARFLDVDLRVRIIDNDRDRRRIVQRAEPVGSVRIRNNIVVNNVIDVTVVERETGRKVPRVRVRETDNPREARAGDEEIAVFNGRIERKADAKPRQVSDVEEVKRKRPRGENADQQPVQRTDEPVDKQQSQESTTQEDGAAPQASKPVRRKQVPDEAVTGDDALETGSTSRPKKVVPDEGAAGQQNNRKAANPDEPAVKPVDRKKKVVPEEGAARQQNNRKVDNPDEPAVKQDDRKKKQAEEGKAKDRPALSDQKPKKKLEKKAKCDPQKDADCQP